MNEPNEPNENEPGEPSATPTPKKKGVLAGLRNLLRRKPAAVPEPGAPAEENPEEKEKDQKKESEEKPGFLSRAEKTLKGLEKSIKPKDTDNPIAQMIKPFMKLGLTLSILMIQKIKEYTEDKKKGAEDAADSAQRAKKTDAADQDLLEDQGMSQQVEQAQTQENQEQEQLQQQQDLDQQENQAQAQQQGQIDQNANQPSAQQMDAAPPAVQLSSMQQDSQLSAVPSAMPELPKQQQEAQASQASHASQAHEQKATTPTPNPSNIP